MGFVLKTGGLVLTAALGAAMVMAGGCASNAENVSAAPPVGKADTPAANLKMGLDSLLREHVVLLSVATSAALGGRNDEYNEAYKALEANSEELAGAIGEFYGSDAHDTFLNLWRKHIGYFVDYTQGAVAKDPARQDKAITDLIAFAQDFGQFAETTGKLKKDAIADMMKTNIVGLRGVIDAQSAKDYATAFTRERDTERQIESLGNVMADAIVDQFQTKF